jgi:hypothetical protein
MHGFLNYLKSCCIFEGLLALSSLDVSAPALWEKRHAPEGLYRTHDEEFSCVRDGSLTILAAASSFVLCCSTLVTVTPVTFFHPMCVYT